MHCRWAMLGVAGAAGAEAITGVSWTDAPVQESQTYLGATVPFSLPVVVGIEIFVMAYVEQQRSQESDPVKRLYPGGMFDPAGFSKGKDFEQLKRKEIANGRVAMLAFAGIIGEAQANNPRPRLRALPPPRRPLARQRGDQRRRRPLPLSARRARKGFPVGGGR